MPKTQEQVLDETLAEYDARLEAKMDDARGFHDDFDQINQGKPRAATASDSLEAFRRRRRGDPTAPALRRGTGRLVVRIPYIPKPCVCEVTLQDDSGLRVLTRRKLRPLPPGQRHPPLVVDHCPSARYVAKIYRTLAGAAIDLPEGQQVELLLEPVPPPR